MKIRNKKDVQILDQRIQEELGVDLKEYRNTEIAEKIGDLLRFPIYATTWAIRPILLAFALYITGYFVIDLVHIQYVIYGLFGLILWVLLGALSGVLLLFYKAREDLFAILEFSLEVMKNVVADLKNLGNKIPPDERARSFKMLFQGVIHIVMIPMITNALSGKIPLVGFMLKWLIKRILTFVSNGIKFPELTPEEAGEPEEELTEEQQITRYARIIDSCLNGMRKALNTAFTTVSIPFLILASFLSMILILFIFLIW